MRSKLNDVGFFSIITLILCIISFLYGAIMTYSEPTKYPTDMRFYMWVEPCSNCGSDMECEYSVASNLGHKSCASCDSSYEYEIQDDKEVVVNEEY